jgi:ATPase subunit of ABC transporter with duplicated ATPase domains
MTANVTLDAVVAAAPADVRETLDDDTLEYLRTAVGGATDPESVRRAVAPFLGMSARELDAMFARLTVDDAPPPPPSLIPTLTPTPTPAADDGKEGKRRKKKDTAAAEAKPIIMAYSQQSRFHSATVTTLSKEVDLRDVNVSVGDAELLVDTRLCLKAGTHYGLVGRNGTGKSTLLSVLGDHSLVGFPENLRTLYVQQLDVVDSEDKEDTVLEAVLRADGPRAVCVAAVGAIEADAAAGLEAHIQRVAADRVTAAQKTATLRSGARGKTARGAALKAEQGMLAAVRAEVFGAPGQEKTPAEAAPAVLEGLYAELDAMDAHSAEARARAILANLDVGEDLVDGPVRALSGGWRMRVALAQALFVQPDILLLDECTNHLDLAAIAWLQNYLTSLDITLVCVSHDRDFLNAVSGEVIRLKDHKLSYHPGNYDEYEQGQDELRRRRERQHASLERRREHVRKSIERFKAHARASNDDKVLGQVASRNKKLERMGVEKTEDGKRFKVSYWAGHHDTLRPEVELIKAEKEVDLRLPQPDPLPTSAPVLALHSVSFAYPCKKHRVLKSVSLSLMHGDHIAVLGLNGCGKSTLISLIQGALQPTHGRVERNGRLRIGHYTQHFVDELSAVGDSAVALLAHRIRAAAAADPVLAATGLPEPKESDLRKWLGGFEISGALATRPVNTLSGGQRARLAMALMLHERPHMLLLDEITNHLDMYAVQGLVAALNEYEGTVVLVTHDRHFVRETADDVYALEGGRLTLLEGGIDEYVAQFDS